MPETRANMLVPAIIGGLAAGVLSALPVANCFCCLWIIAGAILATYLYFRESSALPHSADAVLIGVLTGLVATLVDFFLSIPFRAMSLAFAQRFLQTLAQFTEEMPAGWENWLEKGNLAQLSLPLAIFSLMIRAIIFAGLGALGGVIGLSLFGRRQPVSPPPSSPPPPLGQEPRP